MQLPLFSLFFAIFWSSWFGLLNAIVVAGLNQKPSDAGKKLGSISDRVWNIGSKVLEKCFRTHRSNAIVELPNHTNRIDAKSHTMPHETHLAIANSFQKCLTLQAVAVGSRCIVKAIRSPWWSPSIVKNTLFRWLKGKFKHSGRFICFLISSFRYFACGFQESIYFSSFSRQATEKLQFETFCD